MGILNNIKVYKFGGASLATGEGFRNVSKIITNAGEVPLVVVVSALGKTTNLLEKMLANSLAGSDSGEVLYQQLYTAHRNIALNLIDESVFNAQIEPILIDLKEQLSGVQEMVYDQAYDQVVSYGELLSSQLLFAYMKKERGTVELVNASDLIRTDDTWRDARVDWDETQKALDGLGIPVLEKGKILLTQGFVGGTKDGFTTTLGREGSDYSGAILAYSLNADSLTIWKDVPGILSADPKQFSNVVSIDRLSFLEAIEMTYYGAKVIHPKTIKPLQNKNIPLWVRSFKQPDQPGTLIFSEIGGFYPPVVVLEKDQVLLQISTTDFSFVAERHLAHIFQCLDKYRVKVNLMRNSAINFSVCVTNPGARLDDLIEALQQEFSVRFDKQIELVTVRHYDQLTIDRMKEGKLVMLEESIKDTYQMVVKAVPPIKRI